MTRALLLLAALLAAAPAVAKESPRRGSFELRALGYRPDIDDEFGGTASPYSQVFGGSRRAMFRADVAWTLFRRVGSIDLGIGAGFFQARGHGLLPSGARSADPTLLRIVPTSLSLTYRMDVLAERYSIPLAPYARVALERYNWWITRGDGDTATAGGQSGAGATNGYTFAGGVAFLLDIIDRGLAADMDRSSGINDTYVFVEMSRSRVDDFGSGSSMDLSPDRSFTLAGGLLFVF